MSTTSQDGTTTGPMIEEREAQPYLAMARSVTDGVPAVADEAFPSLFRWLGEQGVEPSGPPFIRIREIDRDGEPLELEVGVPVAGEPAGDGDTVVVGALPAGRYAVLVHVGPYRSESVRDLGTAREDLVAWMRAEGLSHGEETERGSALACAFEQFFVGPTEEPDFTKWRTELAYLVVPNP